MSRERFEWLNSIAGEVIATPGCESNVKEIFDKTWELRNTREDVLIFNQFEEMGNYLWHYNVTGSAIADAFEEMYRRSREAGMTAHATKPVNTKELILLLDKYLHRRQ